MVSVRMPQRPGPASPPMIKMFVTAFESTATPAAVRPPDSGTKSGSPLSALNTSVTDDRAAAASLTAYSTGVLSVAVRSSAMTVRTSIPGLNLCATATSPIATSLATTASTPTVITMSKKVGSSASPTIFERWRNTQVSRRAGAATPRVNSNSAVSVLRRHAAVPGRTIDAASCAVPVDENSSGRCAAYGSRPTSPPVPESAMVTGISSVRSPAASVTPSVSVRANPGSKWRRSPVRASM